MANRRLFLNGILVMMIGLLSSSIALAGPQEDADASLAAGQWDVAAHGYKKLLKDDPSNAQNWFNLAQSHHASKNYMMARDAYLKSLSSGIASESRVRFHLARAYMSLGRLGLALDQLEIVAKIGGPSPRSVDARSEFAPLRGNPRYARILGALKPCNSDEYRKFDFWLGDWDVTQAGASQVTGTNIISRIQDGCSVLEQYSTRTGGVTGTSLSFYDASIGLWHQTYVSNGGGTVYLEGNLNGEGAMVLTDTNLPVSKTTGTVNRMTLTPKENGSVHQLWETSGDGGASWAVSFDAQYTRQGPIRLENS